LGCPGADPLRSVECTVPLDAAAPDAATATNSFADLGLPEPLRRVVDELGFTEPTPIQQRAIPALLSGRDITGVAQTGTGKTAAFGLPLLAGIDPQNNAVQALVLTPTRELALQVADAIESFAAHLPDIRVLAVYGGAPYVPQQRALKEGVQVVVGTPGRVMDHMERGALVLDQVKFLVLDEADEMLRMGFAEDVETIFSDVPRPRQVALFSATMPSAIRAVADKHQTDSLQIAVTPQASTVDAVHQTYAIVPFRHKIGALVRVLATTDADAAIVFCRTRSAAEEVGSALIERGIAAATISGDVAQAERERIVERLRSGALDVLVATDVAARGLDVDRIGIVINFDIPREAEAYVHRIGRTGRAGRTGQALTFVTPHERNKLRHIENTIKARIEEVQLPSPRDVSAYKAAKVLMAVPERRKAGRLEMYQQLVREQLLAGSDYDVVDPDRAIALAAALLALAVGDDGPRMRAEQEEFEREQQRNRPTRVERDGRERDRRGRGGEHGRSRDREDRGGFGERGERHFERGGRPERRSERRAVRDDYGVPLRGRGKRYRVSVGHKDGVSPGGIVGAITGEAGLTGRDIGKIDIYPSFSLVDIDTPLNRAQLVKLSKARVAGRALNISEDKGPKR